MRQVHWTDFLQFVPLIFVALALLGLIGCGHVGTQDTSLESLIKEFSEFYDTDTRGLDVGFAKTTDLDSDKGSAYVVIGVCYSNGKVELDREFWNTAAPIERKALLWHELGHCAKGWQHVDTVKNGCATEYMNSVLPSENCLERIFKAKGISYDAASHSLVNRALAIFKVKGFEL